MQSVIKSNGSDLSNISYKCILKVRKCQLDRLSRFGIMEEKQRERSVTPHPPGKVGSITPNDNTNNFQFNSIIFSHDFGF